MEAHGKQQGVPSREVTLQGLVSSLQEVLTPVGVQASTDHLFKGAVFGRDSLRVAEDLLAWFPSISRQVIVTLAHHQGREIDRLREEEPGRIHHEYRADFFGYEKVGREQLEIMEHLGAQWGWLTPGHELCYYGTVDATPQFARLVCSFASRYGRDLLFQEIRHRGGQSVTVRESLLLALAWIVRRLKDSPLGLLEFQRANPRGIRFQVMRDGALSYAHADGTLANADAPIASLEVQGLAYDALTQSAELLGQECPREAEEWRRLAGQIQATVLERFWMEDQRYFAMALDRTPDGTVRPLRTLSTVPDELLETGIFDSLPDTDRRRYVEAIVRRIYSEEFLTDAGIRSLARRHGNRFGRDLWEYQGARVVWAVMTNVFARGLRRQGLLALARDIENRTLNAAALSGLYAEFFYVDLEGRVVYDPKGGHRRAGVPARIEGDGLPPSGRGRGGHGRVEPRTILGTNLPERTQAWTVSALLRAFLAQEEEPIPAPTPLEEELLGRGPTERLRGTALAAAFPTSYAYQVDTKRAQAIEREILESAND